MLKIAINQLINSTWLLVYRHISDNEIFIHYHGRDTGLALAARKASLTHNSIAYFRMEESAARHSRVVRGVTIWEGRSDVSVDVNVPSRHFYVINPDNTFEYHDLPPFMEANGKYALFQNQMMHWLDANRDDFPSGSGFDNGWSIEVLGTSASIKLVTSFHYMNGASGMYEGWLSGEYYLSQRANGDWYIFGEKWEQPDWWDDTWEDSDELKNPEWEYFTDGLDEIVYDCLESVLEGAPINARTL